MEKECSAIGEYKSLLESLITTSLFLPAHISTVHTHISIVQAHVNTVHLTHTSAPRLMEKEKYEKK